MIRYILAILLLLPQFSYAIGEIKNNTLTGRVTDSADGVGLPGVSIFIPELQKGTVSDANGSYQLANLPNSKITVQFSFIGYESSINTISIVKENTKLDISLPFTSVTTQDVVVSGGFPSAQHENTVKISVLSNEELKLLSNTSLGEKLANIPGVDVISRSPGVSTPVIRGLSLNNILFLNNGVRMENFQFSTDHPFLVNDQGADHIEVIKGPASLLYGSDAMGGVINILHEKPAPSNTLEADISSHFYSASQGIVSNVGVKESRKNWFWMLRANQQSHKDYKDGGRDYVPNSRFNSKGLQLGFGLVKNIGSFKIYYDYLRPKLGMTTGESVSLVDTDKRTNNYWYQDLTQHILSSRNRLFLGNYKLELNAAYQANQRRLNGDPDSDNFRLVDMDLNTFTYDSKLYFPSSDTNEFLVGIQGMHQSNTNHEAPNRIIPDAKIDDFSVFSLFKKDINRIGLQLGLRYDHRSLYVPEQEAGGHSHAEAEEEEHEEDEDHEEETIHINRNFDNMNASLGITYHLNDKLLFRSNIATGFRAPNLAELSQNGLHGDRYEVGDTNLDPQRSLESDLGVHYHSNIHTLDFSLFYNRVYDYIYLSPTNEIAPDDSGFIYRYSQQDAKLYGGELALDLALNSFIKYQANYAMVIGKKDQGGRLPYIPQHKFKNSIRFSAKGNRFFKSPFVNLSWKHAFEQKHPSQFETKTAAYDLVAIQAGSNFKIAKLESNLLLSVDNLFNEKYVDHLSSLKMLGFYNPGRNFNVKFTLKI
ncbi:TonB-dependent receptor [Ancylomarina sp. 16SWW S1-10-2]|uniref:TonB-dependent receptor n=1 Tax=Ancylomarina sp. 16SWW S1-10-2 TaxID=2499681 RepID=UPI0012AE86B9|nr:TonB-dependent receptor [Ancylomarina sp. 16SWW S1-10-2]MRT91510.1 TonB-dependent receptor [Ancylomarina sp. 16SWW S1-10-2]